MNALEILKQDHERISSLIHELEVIDGNATDPERQRVFTDLKNAFLLHDLIEEDTFYPALVKFEETRASVEKSQAEHDEIDKILFEMERGQGDWEDNLSKVKQSVQDHINKEENELFPLAEKILGGAELKSLGGKIKKLVKEATVET